MDEMMMGGMPPGMPGMAPPGMPPMGGGMGMPPMDEDMMLMMLLEAVMGKWQGDEAQLAGEKDALLQTLMMLAQAGGEMPPGDFVEGGGMAPPQPPMMM